VGVAVGLLYCSVGGALGVGRAKFGQAYAGSDGTGVQQVGVRNWVRVYVGTGAEQRKPVG
jgi:hypothetical protein